MLTSAFAGNPPPARVKPVPATPMSGVVFKTPIWAAGFDAGATGPGRGATPGSAGGLRGVGVAPAGAATSSAPAAPATATASVPSHDPGVWMRLLIVFSLSLRDDRDRVEELPDLAVDRLELDRQVHVSQRVARWDRPRGRPEPHRPAGDAVGAPVEGDLRDAGSREVAVLDVVDRQDLAATQIEAPRADDDFLATLEHVRLRAANRAQAAAVDRVRVERDIELRRA